ncbi:MAG: RNA pseudouridine synthase [Flavobacteriales bacterium]|nr:RNA pseudouridine synthase [Flavobacteriales bacterium]
MPANSIEATAGPSLIRQGADWVAVYKPAGIPVQPDPSGSADLLTWTRAATGDARLELVNRLDRPVSGVVVMAAGQVLEALNRTFRERQVRKTYHAIVEGSVNPDGPIELVHRLVHDARTHRARQARANDKEAREVHLNVRVLHRFERYTLVELEPREGAFHQLRAQLSFWGHPIKGDVKYGARRGEPDRSIALHALRLGFPDTVTKEQVFLEAPIALQGVWRLLSDR